MLVKREPVLNAWPVHCQDVSVVKPSTEVAAMLGKSPSSNPSGDISGLVPMAYLAGAS